MKRIQRIRNSVLLVAVLVAHGVIALEDRTAGEGTASAQQRQLTVDDAVGELLDNPAARAVLEAELPGFAGSEQINQARTLSLRALQPFAPSMLTNDTLDALDAALVRAGALSEPGRTIAPAPVATDPSRALRLDTFPLWPGRAPGATGEDLLDVPTLTMVATDGTPASGAAVIVAPGGGYQMLATGHEGRQVADWFAAHGVTAFVLTYRLCTAGYHHPTQLWDAQRAVRWVRAHAKEYGIDPGRIGMMGFSAGGHLTAMVETLFDAGDPQAQDPVERVSSRPDFAILAYAPVGVTLAGSEQVRASLCIAGSEPTGKTLRELAPLDNISSNTPPTFLFHTSNDELVPAQNASRYYDALLGAGVSAELHIFAAGRHGQGLALTDPALAMWPLLLANWLRGQDLIGRATGDTGQR